MSEKEPRKEEPTLETPQPIEIEENRPETKLDNETKNRRVEEADRKDSEEMQNARRELEVLDVSENQKKENVKSGAEFEGVRSWVRILNNLFEKRYKISVPQEELPKIVKANPGEEPAYVKRDLDNDLWNAIRVQKENQIQEGKIAGEELSHFYRNRFKPSNITIGDKVSAWFSGAEIHDELIVDKNGNATDKHEHLTDEFFGFLGRRLLHGIVKKDEALAAEMFPNGEPKLEDSMPSKEDVLRHLKAIRMVKGNLNESYKKDILSGELTTEKSDVYSKKQQRLRSEREDLLRHYRGYEFASKFDLSKIRNWQKLYSMSDKEVRRRFFTDKPDYSGL